MENETFNKKDDSKEKIILFVIGVLVGAVISTAAFLIYTKTIGTDNNSSSNSSSSQQMPGGGGTPPEMPSGQSSQGGQPGGQSTQNTQNSNS